MGSSGRKERKYLEIVVNRRQSSEDGGVVPAPVYKIEVNGVYVELERWKRRRPVRSRDSWYFAKYEGLDVVLCTPWFKFDIGAEYPFWPGETVVSGDYSEEWWNGEN